MTVFPAIFVLILCANFISSHVLLSDEDHEIVWPTEYHFNAEMYNFETTLKTPFEIWSSAEQNRGRIDYYGGVTKAFYNGDENSSYMVFPMTDSEMNVEVTCMMVGADVQGDFMPEVSLLRYTGQTINLFDKIVEVWTGRSNEGDGLVTERTLYVYRTEHGVDIPVQHVIKNNNEKNGEMVSEIVINYYNYKDSVSAHDLLNEVEDCTFSSDFKKNILMLHPDLPEHLDFAFHSYAAHHSKEYHDRERVMRKQIFEKNWRKVQKHNLKNLGFKMEVNEFSDRTPEELKYLNGLLVSDKPTIKALPFPHTLEEINNIVEALPQEFDLRFEGAVTPIKNQGNCGSCWAFAVTAAVEGAFARISGDRLLDFSEQSVVDCGWSEGNMGCNGGLLDIAWKYIFLNGIPTERDYGVYMETDGFCHISNMTTLYKIKGFTEVTPRNPNALKLALYKYGPVTIGVEATDDMVSYASGLFYDLSCDPDRPRLNHAVTVVGYGTRDGEDYWIVKNSWGEDGYILMLTKNNNCFVLDYPYYPIV